jgi:hypothetical protein
MNVWNRLCHFFHICGKDGTKIFNFFLVFYCHFDSVLHCQTACTGFDCGLIKIQIDDAFGLFFFIVFPWRPQMDKNASCDVTPHRWPFLPSVKKIPHPIINTISPEMQVTEIFLAKIYIFSHLSVKVAGFLLGYRFLNPVGPAYEFLVAQDTIQCVKYASKSSL